MTEEEFLTIPEVATLLRIGQRTTYDLARRGKLGGAIKVGSQWRVELRAFRQWVADSERLHHTGPAPEGRPQAPKQRQGAQE